MTMHAPIAQPPREAPVPAWPSPASGWLLAALLALASIVSQFDRTVINLTVQPLKAAFDLDDTHFGMLQGIAFGLFYVVACVPLGRMADRYQRRWIIAGGLFLFSCFAMGSGLATSFAVLFLTRVGVGVGEATLTPSGLSMLSDHFPPDQLGRPVGAFLMSAPFGQGLAFILGGSLLQWLSTSSILTSGPLAGLQPYQAAFIIVGAPGLLLVPLFLMLREPVRRGGGKEPMPFSEVVGIVRSRSAALIPMFAGFSMVTLVVYAIFIWAPAMFQRSYGWNPGQIGLGFGVILMTCGMSGAYFSGWLTDRLTRKGYLDAPLLVAGYGFVGCGCFGAAAALMPSAPLALAFFAPAIFLSNMPFACAATSIQLIIPNRARAQVSALYITLTTLVGLSIGPMVIGLMTDHLFRDPADVRYSLAIIVGVPAPIMFILMMLARRPYRALRAMPA
jgi:MFS family permease